MSDAINAVDEYLQAAAQRLLPSPNAAILLASTAPVFKVTASSVPTPTSVTITATLQDMDGTVTFGCVGGTLTSISGNSCVLLYSNLTASSATITATLTYRGTVFSKSLVISKIIDGTGGSNLNNIVPDPTYKDLGFWGRVGYTVNDYSSGSTTWKMASSLRINEVAGTLVDTSTAYFAMTPGATYRVEIQVYLSASFTGSFSPFWLIPGNLYHAMGCPSVGSNWGDGLQISFNSASTKGAITTFTAVYTVPASGLTYQSQIRLKSQMTAGYIEVGSISVVRMTDTALIAPGVTITNPVLVSGLAIAAISDLTGTGGGTGVLSSRTYGTRTATPSGGTAPYTYSWAVLQSDGTYPITATGTTTASITLSGKGKDEINGGTISVTVTDSSGLSSTKSFSLSETHGTPP